MVSVTARPVPHLPGVRVARVKGAGEIISAFAAAAALVNWDAWSSIDSQSDGLRAFAKFDAIHDALVTLGAPGEHLEAVDDAASLVRALTRWGLDADAVLPAAVATGLTADDQGCHQDDMREDAYSALLAVQPRTLDFELADGGYSTVTLRATPDYEDLDVCFFESFLRHRGTALPRGRTLRIRDGRSSLDVAMGIHWHAGLTLRDGQLPLLLACGPERGHELTWGLDSPAGHESRRRDSDDDDDDNSMGTSGSESDYAPSGGSGGPVRSSGGGGPSRGGRGLGAGGGRTRARRSASDSAFFCSGRRASLASRGGGERSHPTALTLRGGGDAPAPAAPAFTFGSHSAQAPAAAATDAGPAAAAEDAYGPAAGPAAPTATDDAGPAAPAEGADAYADPAAGSAAPADGANADSGAPAAPEDANSGAPAAPEDARPADARPAVTQPARRALAYFEQQVDDLTRPKFHAIETSMSRLTELLERQDDKLSEVLGRHPDQMVQISLALREDLKDQVEASATQLHTRLSEQFREQQESLDSRLATQCDTLDSKVVKLGSKLVEQQEALDSKLVKQIQEIRSDGQNTANQLKEKYESLGNELKKLQEAQAKPMIEPPSGKRLSFAPGAGPPGKPSPAPSAGPPDSAVGIGDGIGSRFGDGIGSRFGGMPPDQVGDRPDEKYDDIIKRQVPGARRSDHCQDDYGLHRRSGGDRRDDYYPPTAAKAAHGPPPTGDQVRTLLMIVLIVRDEASQLQATDLVCSDAFSVWPLTGDPDYGETAVMSLPITYLTEVAAIAQLVCAALDRDAVTAHSADPVTRTLPAIHHPQGPVTAITRLDIAVEDGVDPREAMHLLQNGTSLPRGAVSRSLALHDAAMAAADCMRQLRQPTELQSCLMLAVISLCSDQPVLRRSAMSHPRRDLRPREGPGPSPNAAGYSSSSGHDKRQQWQKSPAADIQSVFPDCTEGMTLVDYHLQILECLHTPAASKVPLLLRESEPFMTFMNAVVSAHAASKPYGKMLRVQSTTRDLQRLLRCVEEAQQPKLLRAQAAPNDELLQEGVAQAICSGLAVIRATLTRTTLIDCLTREAAQLVDRVARIPADSQMEFMAAADDDFTNNITLWGFEQGYILVQEGALTNLFPTLIRRLNSVNQARAMEFFNGLVRDILNNESVATPRMYRAIKEKLEVFGRARPSLPSFSAFNSDPERSSTDMVALQERIERRHSASAGYLQILSTPEDLGFLAKAGILFAYWRPFMDRMLNGYISRQPASATPATGLYASEAEEPPGPDADGDLDDEVDMMPLTRRQQAEGSATPQDAPPRPQGGPQSSAPSRPRRPPSVTFARDTADKLTAASEKSTAQVKQLLEQLQESMSTMVDKKLGAAMTRSEKNEEMLSRRLTALQERISASADRHADEQAQMLRTAQKLLKNIADQTSDLRHAPTVRDGATALGAMADKATTKIATAPQTPTIAAVDAGCRHCGPASILAAFQARARKVDANGMKNSHVPPNDFDEYSAEYKQVYADRDGVRTKREFEEKVAHLVCTNCPPDAPNMPHDHAHCPSSYMTTKAAQNKMGEARVVKARQRVKDNMTRLKGGQPLASFLAMAADSTDDDDSLDALAFMADVCAHMRQDIEESTSIDEVFMVVDQALAAPPLPARE